MTSAITLTWKINPAGFEHENSHSFPAQLQAKAIGQCTFRTLGNQEAYVEAADGKS